MAIVFSRLQVYLAFFPTFSRTKYRHFWHGNQGNPENATGNFVKIVRRVPVKILIDHGLENWPFLPLGLSVAPTVYFK